jgi:hypothetical protein
MIARDWSEGDYESVRPPKYIRDYLVTLSRKPRNDRSISTFAKAFLALGYDRFIIARDRGGEWRIRGRAN